MKILELADEVFYGFASNKVKFKPEIHEHEMVRNSDGVRLKIYFGGEVEDIRTFNFKDFECLFFDGRFHKVVELNSEWARHLVRQTDFGKDDAYKKQWNAIC